MAEIDWEEVAMMIDDCEERSHKMNAWELGFIDSISKQYAQKGSLSEKQVEKLNGIWERVTE